MWSRLKTWNQKMLSLFFRDITARKLTSDSESQSEERYRTLFESIEEGFCIVEIIFDDNSKPIDYRFIIANPAFEKQTGRKDAVGKTVREMAPFHEEYWFERYGNVALTGKSIRFEDRAEEFQAWYEVHAYRVGEPELRQVGIVFSNITERKIAEVALRQSEERYRTLFESIDEGFCIIEVLFDETDHAIDYRFLEINPAFALQTGLEGAIGKTIRQLDPNIEDYWCFLYGKIVQTGEPRRFENYWKANNRWFDIYACRTGQPQDRKVAVVFKDISERKQAEQEREQLFIREQAAREAAENANRIKDEFLAVLSHELRSPLNPILGWAKLLKQGKLDAAKTLVALDTIERNTQLQVQLISDLLDISGILRGKLSLEQASVDLSQVIASALETVRLAIEAKSLQIKTIIPPNIKTVLGDAGRLQQVVWNLLSNAVKFTRQRGHITVALTQTETYAQIQVTDTGKGIKRDFLPYVFEHFRQEDGAITRQFGGLGLGLAIARKIVEMHGGTITVDSPGEGQGATFTVQLPLALTSNQLPCVESLEVSINDLSSIRILVVDDEPDSREFVAFVLEQAGASVTSVASGIEALQIVERLIPDVIVSDIGMPQMDGYMLLQQMRAQSSTAQIPAIALTAYAGEFDQKQALQAGFQYHLAKPVEPEKIITTVARLCEQKQKSNDG